jgi:carboxyl-terminal processing protease
MIPEKTMYFSKSIKAKMMTFSRTKPGLIVFVLFFFLLTIFPVNPQLTRENLYWAYVRNAYQHIRTSYYREVSEETLVQGAADGMNGILPQPVNIGYNWMHLESLFFQQSKKFPGLAGKLAEASIDGMVKSLNDPYSVLLTPEKIRVLNNQDNCGIGIEMGGKNGRVVVIAPLPGSPAEKAGMKNGDIIAAVNGVSTLEKGLYETAMLIDGRPGEKIKITVIRNGNRIDCYPVFSRFSIDPLYCCLLTNNIGYIRVRLFNGKIFDEFTGKLKSMRGKKVKGLIIDLRNNPGGDFMESLRLAARFVPEGNLVWVKRRDTEPQPRYSGSGEKFPVPVVVLVNEGSASASEVFAAALVENDKALLMGRPTFGKAAIQTQYKLTGGALLNITTETYLTPKMNNIEGTGIKPRIILDDCSQKDDPVQDSAVKQAWKYLNNL